MRRKDKQIADQAVIDEIIAQCEVCRLGLTRENVPYIVPMSFGYDGENFYFHTAKEGRKIAFFEAGNMVCFELDTDVETVRHEENACNWTSRYKSVIGYGNILEITESEEKVRALNAIMLQYSGKEWPFTEQMVATVRVWKLAIENVSAKQSPSKKKLEENASTSSA